MYVKQKFPGSFHKKTGMKPETTASVSCLLFCIITDSFLFFVYRPDSQLLKLFLRLFQTPK